MAWQPVDPLPSSPLSCHARVHTQVSTCDLDMTAGAAASSLLAHTPVAGQQLPGCATKVRPSPAFLQVLHAVGATGDTFTKKEVCILLRDYIVAKQLYDENDPRIIYCANDVLGQVFGCSNFTIGDVTKLLQANCTIVGSASEISPDMSEKNITQSVGTSIVCESPKQPQKSDFDNAKMNIQQTSSPQKLRTYSASSSSSQNPLPAEIEPTCSNTVDVKPNVETPRHSPKKRPANSIQDMDREFKIRRTCERPLELACDEEQGGNIFPWFCREEMHDSDVSEVLSIQSKETEYVKDSSDDLWFVEDEDDKDSVFSLEYEVESVASETCDDQEDAELSHTDTEEEAVVEPVTPQDSEMNFWADSSDISSDESDTEIPKQDKWHCKECGTGNRPMDRHCARCWKLRPGWLAGKQRLARLKKSATFPAAQSRTYDYSDDSDFEDAPWVPVEKALHKLRSTCRVPDTEPSSQSSCASSASQNVSENKTQTLPLNLPNSSGSPLSAPASSSSFAVSVTETGNDPKHSVPSATSTSAGLASFSVSSGASSSVPQCATTNSVSCVERSAVTSSRSCTLQRASTPVCSVGNSPPNSQNINTSCNFVSASDISFHQSPGNSPKSNQPENLCVVSDKLNLQQCDSGISSLESNLSEGSFLNSSHKLCSLTATKCKSAPTTPVKNLSGASDCLLTPSKRNSVLQKFKGLPVLTATRRTLSHYQIATPSSSTSPLRHCSSAPVIVSNAAPTPSVKSPESQPTCILNERLITDSPVDNKDSSKTVKLPGVTTGTQTHTQLNQTRMDNKDGVSSVEQSDWCVICLTKPKDASIIHGRTGHQVCCYSCAKRLRRRGKPCPVCRRDIQRVIKNYVM